jgi:PTH1 family peptidyl-tRNA hydrolase
MYIIAGLGNPTRQYEKTRHNVGFDALDVLAENYQIKIDNIKFNAVSGSGMINGQKVLLVKPLTYMNLSGEAIRDYVNFYKINPEEELLVLYDDISLAPGKIRLRKKGSAGGHNGIKNIIAHLGTEKFKRIKIGVGEKPEGWDLKDYVLGRFPKEDRVLVEDAFVRAAKATELILEDQFDKAMNLYN